MDILYDNYYLFQEISHDDLLRAIKKLKVLGNGFTVIPLGSGRFLVQSIPGKSAKHLINGELYCKTV